MYIQPLWHLYTGSLLQSLHTELITLIWATIYFSSLSLLCYSILLYPYSRVGLSAIPLSLIFLNSLARLASHLTRPVLSRQFRHPKTAWSGLHNSPKYSVYSPFSPLDYSTIESHISSKRRPFPDATVMSPVCRSSYCFTRLGSFTCYTTASIVHSTRSILPRLDRSHYYTHRVLTCTIAIESERAHSSD
jgi:hypothetical protein